MTSNPSGGSAKWLQVQQEASPAFEANPVKSIKPVNHSFGPVGVDCGRFKSPSSAERLRPRRLQKRVALAFVQRGGRRGARGRSLASSLAPVQRGPVAQQLIKGKFSQGLLHRFYFLRLVKEREKKKPAECFQFQCFQKPLFWKKKKKKTIYNFTLFGNNDEGGEKLPQEKKVLSTSCVCVKTHNVAIFVCFSSKETIAHS